MKKELFGTIDGKEVYKYLLSGDGVSVAVIDYGATVQSIMVTERSIQNLKASIRLK